jgi:hypothetical protein
MNPARRSLGEGGAIPSIQSIPSMKSMFPAGGKRDANHLLSRRTAPRPGHLHSADLDEGRASPALSTIGAQVNDAYHQIDNRI